MGKVAKPQALTEGVARSRKSGKNRRVRVATSDGMEQVIILGHGALRVSARMFHEEVQNVEKQIRALVQGQA